MALFQQLPDNADILQQVSVAELFGSMALSVAEAQQKLDGNSIAQLIRLSEQEVAGKSLLELGFIPSFYSFSYVDISASLSLHLSMKEDFSIGIQASLSNTNKSDLTEDQLSQLEQNESSKERTETSNSRDFTMSANESRVITINQQNYSVDDSKHSIERIESLSHAIRTGEEVRVKSKVKSDESLFKENTSTECTVKYLDGYITISALGLQTNIGILEVPNGSSSTTVTLRVASSGVTLIDFSTTTIFSTAFANAKAANDPTGSNYTYGLTENGIIIDGSTTTPIPLNVYFDTDVRSIVDFSYNTTRHSSDHLDVKICLYLLSLILINDNSVKVTLVGHTDGSGATEYNRILGNDRADCIRNYLLSLGVAKEQILINPRDQGESGASGNDDPQARKVEVKLVGSTNYICFYGGNITSSASPDSGSIKFIVKPESAADMTLNFKFDGISCNSVSSVISDISSAETYIDGIQVNGEEVFESSMVGDVLYVIKKDTEVKYTVFSSKSQEISMTSEKESSFKISENISSKSILKKDTSKLDTQKSLAFTANIDVRYSRQFGMSMDGNASMSARLVAVPPPTAFLTHVTNTLKNQ